MGTATLCRLDDALRQEALNALAAPRDTNYDSHPAFAKLSELGTQLWLDTGNLDEAKSLWHNEFSALTTNNTLANQVVQTGALDGTAQEALKMLRAEGSNLSEEELVMELGFVVNCNLALRLVRAFGVKVSVELHPGISENMERTVEFAERYYAVCPEKFIIKIPLTPEGYCAVARVRAKGIPVNYTLGFGARQNYLAAMISNPTYCNVFLGRLNAVVSDNGQGDGKFVGEKACMATQVALRELRTESKSTTQLIAASMRSASQINDLAGTDVFTMPPKAVKDFLAGQPDAGAITSQIDRDFPVEFNEGVDTTKFDVLWDVNGDFRRMCDQLAARGGVNLTGDDLRAADKEHGTKLFYPFSDEEQKAVRDHGKIPDLKAWANKPVALDDLMTQCALQSFTVDQAALDERLKQIIRG